MTALLVAQIVGVFLLSCLSLLAGGLFWDFVKSDRFLRMLLNGTDSARTPALMVEAFRAEGLFEQLPGEIDPAGTIGSDDYPKNILRTLTATRYTSRIFRGGIVVGVLAICALGYWLGGIPGGIVPAASFLIAGCLPLGSSARENRVRIFRLILWNLHKLKRENPAHGAAFVRNAEVFRTWYEAL